MKLIDNALSTLKTIYLSKDKYITASIFNALSTLFYLLAIVKIAKSTNIYSVIAMCIATLLGTLIPSFVIKKSEGDKLWKFNIVSDNLENGKIFADKLRGNNLAISTKKIYNKHKNKALEIDIYCDTKEKSQMVRDLVPESFDINVILPYKNKKDLF